MKWCKWTIALAAVALAFSLLSDNAEARWGWYRTVTTYADPYSNTVVTQRTVVHGRAVYAAPVVATGYYVAPAAYYTPAYYYAPHAHRRAVYYAPAAPMIYGPPVYFLP